MLKTHVYYWIAWILLAVIFAGDLGAPSRFEVHLLYVGVIVLGVWTPRRQTSVELAAASTLLILSGYYLSPVAGDVPATAFNLGADLFVLWVTALGVRSHRQATEVGSSAVSAQRAAEAALGRSKKDLEDIKQALDQSAIVATTNIRGDITYVNDTFCEISKYSRSELIGRNHRILNSGLHPVEFFKEMYATIGRGHVWRGEIRNRAKDGAFYWVDTTVVPFLDEDGKPYQYIAIRYDITERKQSEATLREQEALTRLGKMAAVVAHEVRNPLAGIRGALQVIGRRLPEGSREQAITGEIVERIDALNNILSDLLQFARPRQPALAPVSLAALLQDTVSFLRQDPALGELDVVVDVTATVTIDAAQVKLALLNLLMNSAQAMQGRGRIRVTARRVGETIELLIHDEGPGIPAEVRERLFEPFFTTKHRGTGLGLATTRRIFEAHRGSIDLYCPPEGGTVARIRLPADPA